MIHIDGTYGEGGGQILRTAISLSCITGKAVEIYRIRANRPKPGLAMQHLRGIEAAKMISNAEVEGLKAGSTRVVFKPRRLRGGKFRIDIGTAGSVTLILQTILLPSLAAEKSSSFEIRGGTDVKWSPPVDYISNVTFKAISELGANVSIELVHRGYYPRGGGLIRVSAVPSELEGVVFTDCSGSKVEGISHCSNLPSHIAERQAKAAEEFFKSRNIECSIGCEVRNEFSTGSGITLWCGYKGGSSLGERGKRAEVVGREAAELLLEEMESGACFDEFLADQIMPFAAVARGKTRYTTSKISMHQRSNAYVVNEFLGDIVELNEDRSEVVIRGKGLI